MKTFLYLLFLVLFLKVNSQERPFYIGHSLVNKDMPKMVNDLAVDANLSTNYGIQIINGSTLRWNYNNATSAEGTPYTTAFPNGNYNNLVITEAVPLQNHLTWSDTYIYANNFYDYAKNNNNSTPIKLFIYETWHCINSGLTGCDYDNSVNSNTLWHPRLQADWPLWTGIVDYVRDENPTNNGIWMIPGGQALYNLTTQINNGNVAGIASFTDLFDDDIHLNNKGNYFIACVMYATIFKQSPFGLTTNINNTSGQPFTDMPTQAQAEVMQQVAWNTVTSLSSWTGVTTLSQDASKKPIITIYPNPSSDFITIELPRVLRNEKVKIFNSLGQLIQETQITSHSEKLNISKLAIGLYYLVIDDYKAIKFVKK